MKKKYVCASNSLRQGQLDRLVRKIKDSKSPKVNRSISQVHAVVRCENCNGTGSISYNPNLNPNSFPGIVIVKCTRCGGTGYKDSDI